MCTKPSKLIFIHFDEIDFNSQIYLLEISITETETNFIKFNLGIHSNYTVDHIKSNTVLWRYIFLFLIELMHGSEKANTSSPVAQAAPCIYDLRSFTTITNLPWHGWGIHIFYYCVCKDVKLRLTRSSKWNLYELGKIKNQTVHEQTVKALKNCIGVHNDKKLVKMFGTPQSALTWTKLQ